MSNQFVRFEFSDPFVSVAFSPQCVCHFSSLLDERDMPEPASWLNSRRPGPDTRARRSLRRQASLCGCLIPSFPHSNPYAPRPNRRGDGWHERSRIHVTVPLRRDRVPPERGGAGTSQDGTSKNWFKITVSVLARAQSRGAGGLGPG